MEKEILDYLKEMLVDYELVYNSCLINFKQLCIEKNVNIGFCFYLKHSTIPESIGRHLMLELIKDLLIEFRILPIWYQVIFFPVRFESKKHLSPRIDHLKRTIARLEKEIETATIN